jgi:hypothetical protein
MREVLSGFEVVPNIDCQSYPFILYVNMIILISGFTTKFEERGYHKDNGIS